MNNLGKSQLSLYQREQTIYFWDERVNVSDIVHVRKDEGI